MPEFPSSTVAGFVAVKIEAGQRNCIESAAGVKLNISQWTTVESLCEEYLSWRRHELAHPDSREMIDMVEAIQKAAMRFCKALAVPLGHPRTQAKDAVCSQLRLGMTRVDLHLLPYEIEEVERATRRAIENIKRQSSSKPGPKESSAEQNFILRLGDMFREAGGVPNATFSPNRDGGRTGGPFVRFVYRINLTLPEEYCLHKDEGVVGDRIKYIKRRLGGLEGKLVKKKI